MFSLNPYVCPLAGLQGIVIGSPEWVDGGLHVESHRSGGHPIYGWNHIWKVTKAFARAAFSNMSARPNHYLYANHRLLNYQEAGRPVGYKPEEAGVDLKNGRRRYVTQLGKIDVTGIDMQHFWLDGLWAVMDSDVEDLDVIGPFGPQPAKPSCQLLGESLMRSLAGMARELDPAYAQGRSLARCLDSFLQAFKHRALPKEDISFWLDWIDQVALPNLENAPGVGPIWGKPNADGSYYSNLNQSLSWMLLPVWELAEAFTSANLDDERRFAERFTSVAVRLSQWMLDIEEIKGGLGKWERLQLNPTVMAGVGGNALPTLKGAVTANDIGGDPWYQRWAVASADVAAHVLGTPEALAFGDAVLQRGLKGHKKADRVWLVDRNRAPRWAA